MKFINFTVVKISICLALGILTGHAFPLSINFFIAVLPFCVVFVLLTWLFARKQLFQNPVFGLGVYLFFFVLGLSTFQLQLPHFQKNHFSNFDNEQSEIVQLKIKEELKPDRFSEKYIAEVLAFNGKKTTGKLLLLVQKDSLAERHSIDDVLLVSASISKLPAQLNPHQFDYRKYMQTLGVYRQARISHKNIFLKTEGSPTLRGRAERVRKNIISKLKTAPLGKDERAVFEALILGQRRDISKEIYQEYAAAGVIHVLSVSGLHVGILYLILAFVFRPMEKLPYGKNIKALAIIGCLFGFALLAGWSPSIARSAVMFAFFTFGTLINRPTNSINTLFLSFFFLLLINPLWLLQVGFQLSYLAVFFILWLQPKLRELYIPRSKVLKYFWLALTVSFTAQLGVLPLSLYYFHQFPGLFLLSNLLVVPYVTLLMCVGLLVLFLALINVLPDWLASFYSDMLWLLNYFIRWVSRQDQFLFEGISFSGWKLVGCYLFLVAFLLLLINYSYKKLLITSGLFAFLLLVSIYDKREASQHELIVFHKSRQTVLGTKNAATLTVYSNLQHSVDKTQYPFKAYCTAKNTRVFEQKKLPKVFRYKKKTIVIIDSLAVFPHQKEVEIILLTQSPKTNLERLLDSLGPKLIVADGSNYPSYVSRWKKTCEKKSTAFHYTGEDGAFVIK